MGEPEETAHPAPSLPATMKSLAAAVVSAFAAVAIAQTEPYCRCTGMVSSEHAEWLVYELPSVNITDCDTSGHDQCQYRCRKEFNEMSNNGDLWSVVEGETVGQYVCADLKSNFVFWIYNSYIHVYYEVCGGPWEYTGLDSQQMLCCSNGEHKHCIS